MISSVTVGAVVPLEVFTIRYAMAVLEAHAGHISKAAAALGVSRFILARMIKRAAVLNLAVR